MSNSYISTLIPVYKLEHLHRTLNSVIGQRLKPNRVIISDDSHRLQLIPELKYQFEEIYNIHGIKIDVIYGPQLGGYANMKNLLNEIDDCTELVHFLFDDDVIFPGFYDNHVNLHENISSSLATISKRTYIDENDFQIPGYGYPDFVEKMLNRIVVLNAESVYPTILPRMNNWLGEFSNAVFKRDCISRVINFKFSNISYYGLGDIGAFLEISEKSESLFFINDNLGAFRIHSNSNSLKYHSKENLASVVAWVVVALHALELNYITANDFNECCLRVVGVLKFRKTSGAQKFIPIIENLIGQNRGSINEFLHLWERFLAEV